MVPRLSIDPPDFPREPAYTLHRHVQQPARITFSVPTSHTPVGGSGILTGFPSATALALTLGADSPCADERCAGNLGLSATGPFTLFIATHVSIRTSDISSKPLDSPSQTYGTLLYHPKQSLHHARARHTHQQQQHTRNDTPRNTSRNEP